MFGVIRQGWDAEGGVGVFRVGGHCFFDTYGGARYPGHRDDRDWERMQGATEQGDCIGLLLDLNQGSMTVWKNDVKLGVIVVEGLCRPLCWAV